MDKQTYRVGATPTLFNGKRVESGKTIELTEEEAADLGDHVSLAPKAAKKGDNA